MDLDLLKAFCQLATDGNYRIASEHLFLTQSALTKKIQRLESHVGTPLFNRGRNGAELTPAGKTLLPEAVRLVTATLKFERLTQSVVAGTHGHLNIGFGVSTYQQAPAVIAKYKAHFPNVRITLNDTPSQHQFDNLLSNELDISFNRLPAPQPLQSKTLFTDKLVIAIHKDHQVKKGDFMSDLQSLPYLKLSSLRGPGLDKQISTFCAYHQLDLTVEQEADDILTLLALVSANLGFTIIPHSAKQLATDNIECIPLLGKKAQWPVGLIWNPSLSDPLRNKFIDFAIQSFAN